MLETFLATLETWEPIVVLRRSTWAYPVASWLHIIGIALLFGTMTTVDLCLIGVLKRLDATLIRRTLVPLALAGFVLALVTGSALFAPAGREYIANPYFLLKLGLIGAAGANAVLLRILLHRRVANPTFQSFLGLLSLAIWATVIFAGRMLAFG